MARFEVLVRPVVFPNIRPASARSLPPEDNPSEGFAVIRGNGASIMNNSFNWTETISQSKRTETQRRVDEARIHQMDDNGTVNQDNFVDVDVANKVWFAAGQKGSASDEYQRISPADNIKIRRRDIMK